MIHFPASAVPYLVCTRERKKANGKKEKSVQPETRIETRKKNVNHVHKGDARKTENIGKILTGSPVQQRIIYITHQLNAKKLK